MTFKKTRPGVSSDYYLAEAMGLEWIRVENGPPIPEVLAVNSDSLELQRIHEHSPSAGAARTFGKALAQLHLSGVEAFGAGPPGSTGQGWIADLPMPFGTYQDFGTMYAQLRIKPYLELAEGAFSVEELDLFESVCEALQDNVEELVGPAEPVARLHGDLWSGNLLWALTVDSEECVWLIDPAAYGGHRESDLAMLQLFGAPYLEQIMSAYNDEYPLANGWQGRVSLHQLYPLLVHTVLFGGGYRRQAVTAARQVLTRKSG